MLVTDFDFELPDDLIAQTAVPRGQSRLFVLDRISGAVSHRSIADLPRLLRRGDLLIVNDTRVVAARLLGRRVPTGGSVECLLLRPRTDGSEPRRPRTDASLEPRRTRTTRISGPFEQPSAEEKPGCRNNPDPPVLSVLSVTEETVEAVAEESVDAVADESMGADGAVGSVVWEALMHPGQKLKPGAVVRFEGHAGVLMGEVLERRFQGRRTIRLWPEWGGHGTTPDVARLDVAELIDALGHVPLPPYIRREDTADDRERYQTVFARARGSVAAPTAGLHFTPELLDELTARGVERADITLHVGYGTFKPITVDRVEDHVVDGEPYSIGDVAAAAITRARAEGRRVIAVGTTTTRALEDAARRGSGEVRAGTATAEIFIHPGFEFQVIDGLLTNFHLPKSSLLMLVSAFAGRERVLRAYQDAVKERYRFYSYGDAMLIL
jgi:S-adenosylmethionine:tRNA ribosyltransferase-isomerase